MVSKFGSKIAKKICSLDFTEYLNEVKLLIADLPQICRKTQIKERKEAKERKDTLITKDGSQLWISATFYCADRGITGGQQS